VTANNLEEAEEIGRQFGCADLGGIVVSDSWKWCRNPPRASAARDRCLGPGSKQATGAEITRWCWCRMNARRIGHGHASRRFSETGDQQGPRRVIHTEREGETANNVERRYARSRVDRKDDSEESVIEAEFRA